MNFKTYFILGLALVLSATTFNFYLIDSGVYNSWYLLDYLLGVLVVVIGMFKAKG